MRISKLTLTKAIALILSMTLLLTCAPAPTYAESPDMPLDTVMEVADGTLKWTEYESVYVLASETVPAWEQDFTLTDYAFPKMGAMMMSMVEAPSGFSLKSISGPTGSFYVGQSGLHGSSGRDAEYKQIATLDGKGKIYATPHFLEGYVVYCLEHTLPGPGENISGGGKQPTGPYLIVDWESYQITDGYSGTIYGEDTMHAIAWVLAHTYPFMVLDRTDPDNETWSRVAGQFAIREVIKQMEGSQYVRDYWRMDEFYAASSNAPAVYLEYARWLARNGIAHANRTGEITVSNKTVGVTGSGYYGTATLTTDVDYMRIAKAAVTITGYTGGEDTTYYYLNSGDTITIYSCSNSFSVKVESMSDDEADFFVGVPTTAIQKVLIPIEGIPHPTKDVTLSCRIEHGAILVAKTDADSGAKLPGATFALLDAAGNVLQTATTDGSGTVTFSALNAGQYQVQEIGAPTGYLLSVPSTQPVTVTAGATSQVAFANDRITSKIRIVKTDAQTGVALAGAVFSVADANGSIVATLTTGADGTLMADTLVATGATDENGMLVFSGTYPHGDYYIRELSAPKGWKVSADVIEITISPAQKVPHENVLRILLTDPIHNELIHGTVTLTKTDISGEKTLPGATIEVYDEDGQVIYRAVTNENGEIPNIPVKPGKYTFREIYAPDGYALNEATMSFTVDADGVVTGDTAIRDDFTRFFIEKYDENERPLAGVEFSLIAANGTAIQTVKTDREGVATFEKVPFGAYRVVETKPLAGYLPAETDVQVTVDETFINFEEPLAVIVNQPNEVLIRKVDQAGKPLPGAEFALVDAFGERFAVAVSDENGLIRFTKVPYGSYTLRELKAPDGYLSSKEEPVITIDEDYRSSEKPLATVVNQRKQVKFIKVDTSGKYLPGVAFSLINAVTLEAVETATSNERGEFIFTRFDYGDWIVRETEAPEGYSRMEDYLLHVDENWTEPKPITLVNIPDTYAFFKSDNKKNALAGAVFAVEDEQGNVVQEVVSAENGVVFIDGLTPGTYIIREIEAPEGFTCSDDTLKVVINEKYTHPAKLKRFVNYPSISTGVDITPTTLTWIGVGLAGMAGGILIVGMKGKRKISGKKTAVNESINALSNAERAFFDAIN